MKKYTISIQSGLHEIEKRLVEEGHTLVPYDQAGMKADVVIISGVDSAYEEIETAQCRLAHEDKENLLINASNLTPDQVINYVNTNPCGQTE